MVFTGEAMLVILGVILVARPLASWFKIRTLMKYRRQLGWIFGTMLALHLGYWVGYYWSTLSVFLRSVQELWLLSGLVAALIGILLTATSNNYAVKKLKKNWKKLHKLTYLLVPLALYHQQYAIKGFDPNTMLWTAVLMSLVCWRFQEAKPFGLMIAVILPLIWTVFEVKVQPEPIEVNEEDIVFVCERMHPESVSCGWPVYLPDGTRIDG